MKICFVLLYYNPTIPPTDPKLLFDKHPIIKELPQQIAALGYQVDFVHLYAHNVTFTENGVHYHFIASGNYAKRFSKLVAQIRQSDRVLYEPALKAIRLVQTLQPDIIHFFGIGLHLNLFLLLQNFGKHLPPTVLHFHGGYPSKNVLVRYIQRFNFKQVKHLLFTTHNHATPFIEADIIDEKRKQVVAFMETSTTFKLRSRVEARAKTGMTGNPIFLWAARLVPLKAPLVVLQGFELILKTWPEAILYMYYLTDELLPDLKAFVNSKPHLQNHVHFKGKAPFEQMESIYNSADFLLQASHREFSGCAVLEAMACGVIPVVSNIPSFQEMTNDGEYGILFPVDNYQVMAEKTLAISLEKIETLSKDIRVYFEHKLSFPAMAQQLNQIYQKILHPHKSYK